MFLGMLSRYKFALASHKSSKFFALLGTIAFVTMIVITLGERQEAISTHASQIIFTMLLFIILTMFVGWFMGGPKKKTRQVLTIVTSTRNAAICLAIAMKTMPEAKLITPLIALSALMIFPNMLFTLFSAIKNRKNE